MPMNKVLLDCYMGSDPIYSESKNGKPLIHFDVKVAKWSRDKKFSKPTDDWHTVWCSGHVFKWVEEVLKLKKGDYIHVQGSLSSNFVRIEGMDKSVRLCSIWASEIDLKREGKNHEGTYFDDEKVVDVPDVPI